MNRGIVVLFAAGFVLTCCRGSNTGNSDSQGEGGQGGEHGDGGDGDGGNGGDAGQGGTGGSNDEGGEAGGAGMDGAPMGGTAGAAAGAAGMSGPYTEDPGTEGDGDVTIAPPYNRDPALTDLGAPKGKSFTFYMQSRDSAIFRGEDSTLNADQRQAFMRRIDVYVPAQYKDGQEAPIMVTQDGPERVPFVRNALDNLTISQDPKRKLPPIVMIAVGNGGGDSKGSRRGLEYDTMSDRFARFINDEVLPAVLDHAPLKAAFPNIVFTKNPWGRGAMGCSSGGAASLTMGWFRPDWFRRIITFSGTFVDQQDDDAAEEQTYPLGAWEYHSGKKLIETSEKKPLRIFLHVSEGDLGASSPESGHRNWVIANQRTAAALKAKGYNYRFVFSKASSHCDSAAIEHMLADTLVWMWRGYHM